MSAPPTWLPRLIQLSDHDGDVDRYLTQVYEIFHRDFRASRPSFRGRLVAHDIALEDGKERAFWHLISETDTRSGDRVPDLRRCERIGWVRAVIEHAVEGTVSVWQNERGKHARTLLWLEQQDYLVVLEDRARSVVLVTAYCTDREHTRAKLRKERPKATE